MIQTNEKVRSLDDQTANPSLQSFELYANMRMDAHIKLLLKAHREQ